MIYRQAKIDETAHIAPNCCIVGDVAIGAECTIFSGAALRGDYGSSIVVGDRTNIQENAVVHVDCDGMGTVIGEDVTIGHGAIVHGCRIGDRTLVGMGSVILSGAIVGSECLIGAGSLLTQGCVIPDGFLAFGSPAKPVRPLTAQEKGALLKDAEDYVEVGRSMEREGLMLSGGAIPENHPTIALAR